jgi:hypothetical protein
MMANNEPVCLFAEDSELPGGATDYVRKLERRLSLQTKAEQSALENECLGNLTKSKQAISQQRRKHSGK